MANLQETIKWLDLSQAGLFLDVRRVGQENSQLLLLDINKKLNQENLASMGFSPMNFESHPHFDGHLYQYTMNQTINGRMFNEVLGVPTEFIRNIYATRNQIHEIFNAQAKQLIPQRLDVALNSATPIGYNSDGNKIYASTHNRFYINSQGIQVSEGHNDIPSSLYLRASKLKDLKECLKGYVHQLEVENKSHTHNDFLKFLALITQKRNVEIDISKVTDKQIHMAEEALEGVLVEKLGELDFSENAFNTALDIYNRMPTKTMRNNVVRMLQQYSTPIPMSFIAQRLLLESDTRTKQNFSVLEPTVGNGSLIGQICREYNASIFAVELDPRRAERTKALTQNYECTVLTADATQIDFEKTFKSKVDYVIANPPFGALDKPLSVAPIRVNQLQGIDKAPRIIDPGENVWFTTDKLDHAIIIKSLNARNDNGRSVFIFGADKPISHGDVEKKSSNFLNYLYHHYQVEGLVEIHANAYARNGANTNVRMIVIGNRKNDQQLISEYKPSSVPKKLNIISTYDELWDWSNSIIYNRLNPNKDLYFVQESPEVSIAPSEQVNQAPIDIDELGNQDLLASLDDTAAPTSQLENIASSISQSSAVTLFDDVIEDKPEDKPQEIFKSSEPEPKKPMFAKKKKDKPKASFDFDSGTVELSESTSGAADDVPKETEVAPSFDNPENDEFLLNEQSDQDESELNNDENTSDPEDSTVENIEREIDQQVSDVEEVLADELLDEVIDIKDLLEPISPSVPKLVQELPPINQVPNTSSEVKEDNNYQVKYVPLSKASEPIALVPKNQVKAINQANEILIGFIDEISEHGPINYKEKVEQGLYPTLVDAYVSEKLKYSSFDALSKAYACEQVDAIAHIVMRFDQNMPVLIGDQTGLGKGRVAAATLRYGAIKGTTPVFLTDTTQLLNDIWRDIVATDSDKYFKNPFIFNSDAVIHRFGTEEVLFKGDELPKDITSIPAQHDLVLGTYSQFNRPNKKRPLLTNFVTARTVLVLDESHKAASMKSATSQFFIDVINQTNLVNFQSATGIKRPENLEFYHKLFPRSVARSDLQKVIEHADGPILEFISEGLVDTSAMIRREQDLSHIEIKTYVPNADEIKNFHSLSDALSDILAEMVKYSKDIRADALENISNDNLASMQLQYDQDSDDPKNRLNLSVMNFGSRMYQIQKQFLLALKTDSTCDAVIKALNEGRKPVIGLENTGESLFNLLMEDRLEAILNATTANDIQSDSIDHEQKFNTFKSVSGEIQILEDELQKLIDKEERDPGDEKAAKRINKELSKLEEQRTGYLQDQISVLNELPQFRDLLRVMLDRIDLVKAQDNYGNAFTKKLSEEVKYDENGEPIVSPYLYVRNQISEKIANFPDLPLMPLDVIRNKVSKAGFNIDEISGRNVFLTEMDSGKWKVNKHTTNNTEGKILVQSRFQGGELDAVLVTRSGCTGISLHAAKNPDPNIPSDHLRQRELFFLQKPENATDTIQMIGRVGRRGEVSHPIMTTIDSGIPAETRMHLMMMRKLSTLSANVSANSETKFNENDYPDMLNYIGNRVALDYLKNNVNMAAILDIKLDIEESTYRNSSQNYHINQLLSKLILMPINQQEQVYQDLVVDYNDKIRELDLLGRNPLKTNFLDWKAKTIKDFEVKDNFFTSTNESESAKLNAFNLPVKFEQLRFIEHVEPLRTENLELLFKESDTHLVKQFQRINPAINETVHGLMHYINNFEALLFQKYESFARQKLFAKNGELRDAFKSQTETIFKHFAIDPDRIRNRDDIRFREPDDHSPQAYKKVAEAVYLGNDELLTANFDRMYTMVLDLRHIARSMAKNEEKGLSAHGLIFDLPKPSLFDDEVAKEHRSGALMRLDLPPLRVSAITPNAIKLDMIYPGDKRTYKVPLLSYTSLKLNDDVTHVAPISLGGEELLKKSIRKFHSNAEGVERLVSNRSSQVHLMKSAPDILNFNKAPSGDVVREAVALTGNMFKAHKIVSSLDIRHSTIIFTDQDGLRNRALLLPTNTPMNLFESSLENQITLGQVSVINNFLSNLRNKDGVTRANFTATKFILPYKKSEISFYFNGQTSYGVTVKSQARQLNKLMSNTKIFKDPKNPTNSDSLNIDFTEPGRNEFKFSVALDQMDKLIKEIEETTRIESAFLELKTKSFDDVAHLKYAVHKAMSGDENSGESEIDASNDSALKVQKNEDQFLLSL